MAAYLSTVERPRGLMIKVVYLVMRRMLGQVPTGTRVFSARMPTAFLLFYNKTYRLDKKLRLAGSTALLVRQRVAGINGCTACLDAGRWFALRASAENGPRLDALAEYETSPLFTDAERAALDYATELTTRKAVSPETFDRLRRHYSDREICDLVWLVASEHLANLTNLGLNVGSDGLCELRPRAKSPRAKSPRAKGPKAKAR